MQVVIKIDEARFKDIQRIAEVQLNRRTDTVEQLIANGTPLPDEYGDLVDRDAINNRFNAICDELEALSNKPTCKELLDKLSMCLDTAEPVIKNNYEEVEKKNYGISNKNIAKRL